LIEHGLTSPPTQYRLYRKRFLQVKRSNQQYQSTEGTKRGNGVFYAKDNIKGPLKTYRG